MNPAGPGNKAFNLLARYIFGDNQRAVRMAMTTPVLSSTTGIMSFIIGPSAVQVCMRGAWLPHLGGKGWGEETQGRRRQRGSEWPQQMV